MQVVLEHVQTFTEWRCKQLHVATPLNVTIKSVEDLSDFPVCSDVERQPLINQAGRISSAKALEHVTIRMDLCEGGVKLMLFGREEEFARLRSGVRGIADGGSYHDGVAEECGGYCERQLLYHRAGAFV